MRLSNYYLPTIKGDPLGANIVSHKYSLKAGLIKQCSSGLYSWLPLGTKVLNNVQALIRQEMDSAGNFEIIMPCIQSADLWRESGRYESYGLEMLRMQDRHKKEMLFSPTNEELITDIVRHNIKSYRDLPRCFYQIQWKFRDEIRPRFGLMRAREFLMKDAYSFDLDKEGGLLTYERMYTTYLKMFKKIGLKPVAVKADSGAIGGDLSHEFHVFAGTGESTIYYDQRLEQEHGDSFHDLQNIYTAADDLHDPAHCPIPEGDLKVSKAIEVGHIFLFGTKYSTAMKAQITDQNGKLTEMYMGSYGIGVSRLIGAIIEANHDDHGIIWPKQIAPFSIGIINLHPSSRGIAEQIYSQYSDTLFDDTEDSAGVKFARMDLIGLPHQLIVGKKSVTDRTVEVKNRRTNEKEIIALDQLDNYIKAKTI